MSHKLVLLSKEHLQARGQAPYIHNVDQYSLIWLRTMHTLFIYIGSCTLLCCEMRGMELDGDVHVLRRVHAGLLIVCLYVF